MSSSIVDQPRASALIRRIDGLDGLPGPSEAVALGLVDALLEGDGETLAAALDSLSNRRAGVHENQCLVGWLDAAIAIAGWGLERAPSGAPVARGTHDHAFLRALAGSRRVGSAELRGVLDVDETQVSRTGRRLLERGFVIRQKIGRQVQWQITPRGRRALEQAPPSSEPSTAGFWKEALRRGFRGASGDEPGEPRDVDPTRELIITSTLELHGMQGIRATTWPEIATKAGVPVEVVEEFFPTLDELARGCGQHFMESLRLPPPDLAGEVFAGASTANERVHRLVETLFAAYEKGSPGITVGRRERREVPAANESMQELDGALDALVVEALRPAPSDGSAIASVRALTDLEVWRTLRDQGASPEAAIDQASKTVERWLEVTPSV